MADGTYRPGVDMTEDVAENEVHGNRIGGALMALVLLLLLYVFSGPPVVLAFLNFTGDVPGPIETFYAPLDWLYDSSEGVQMIMDAEIEILDGL